MSQTPQSERKPDSVGNERRQRQGMQGSDDKTEGKSQDKSQDRSQNKMLKGEDTERYDPDALTKARTRRERSASNDDTCGC